MVPVMLLLGLLTSDPPAGPMLADNYFEQLEEPAPVLFPAGDEQLQEVYALRENPRVLFLLGEPLTDAVSAWHSQSRWRLSQQQTETEASGGTSQSSSGYTLSQEQRRPSGSHRSHLLSPTQWTEFEQGFEQRVLQAGLELLHWNLALRLLDAELQNQPGATLADDPERMSFAVLQQHGDTLVEILPFRHQGFAEQPIGYRIRISSLQDARILADQRLPLRQKQGHYQAGPAGYQRQTRGPVAGVTAESGGYQLHYQPEEPWLERGQYTAEATLQLLYELWQ